MKSQLITLGLAAGILVGMGSYTQGSKSNIDIIQSTNAVDCIYPSQLEATQNSAVSAVNDTLFKKKGLFVENDTTFLYRYVNNSRGYYNFVDAYIETDRQSKSYQKMLNRASSYLLDDRDRNNYNSSFKYLKEKYTKPLPKHSLSNLSRAWIPLSSFQGKYYINQLDIFRYFWLTDSLYIRNYMDGPVPYVIQSFKQVNPTHYHLSVTMDGNNFQNQDLHIIDTKRKIAVLVESDKENKHKRYSLYVSKETASLFDLIVWNSTDMPNLHSGNVGFDKIDFQKLLLEHEQ